MLTLRLNMSRKDIFTLQEIPKVFTFNFEWCKSLAMPYYELQMAYSCLPNTVSYSVSPLRLLLLDLRNTPLDTCAGCRSYFSIEMESVIANSRRCWVPNTPRSRAGHMPCSRITTQKWRSSWFRRNIQQECFWTTRSPRRQMFRRGRWSMKMFATHKNSTSTCAAMRAAHTAQVDPHITMFFVTKPTSSKSSYMWPFLFTQTRQLRFGFAYKTWVPLNARLHMVFWSSVSKGFFLN